MRKRVRTIETDVFGYEVQENPINSKRKGDTNERVAAKFMQEWTGRKWTRTPSSGGLRWQNTSNVCGDIVCEDSEFHVPVVIETKHLKKITVTEKLRSNSRIFSIYDQAKEDAERAKKAPLLLLRGNGMVKGSYILFVTVELPEAALVSSGYCKRRGVSIFGYDARDVRENYTWQNFVDTINFL